MFNKVLNLMDILSKFNRAEKTDLEYTITSMLARANDATIKITPHLARRIIDESSWEGQRAISPWHVTLLASIMRRGEWVGGGQIAFAECKGKLHFVNGHHRMESVIESDMPQSFQVKIHQARTLAEVGEIYYSYDVAARKRSVSDIINASTVSEQTGLPKPFIKKIYDAAGLLSNNLSQPNYHTDPLKASDPNFKISVIAEWAKEAHEYLSLISKAEPQLRKRLLAGGVIAVAFFTLRYQPEKARQFWKGVADNDGLRRGDPRHTYISDLLARNLNTGTILQRTFAPAAAWNAFFDGRQLKIIKVYEDRPVRLHGTPINGEA